MTGIPVNVVDAFSRYPFSGNPAAVCLLRQPAPEKWMQALAGEINLSETAFLVPDQEQGQDRVPAFRSAGSLRLPRSSSAVMPPWRALTSSGRPGDHRRTRGHHGQRGTGGGSNPTNSAGQVGTQPILSRDGR